MASLASIKSSNETGSSLPRSASELDVEHKREMSEAEKLREEVNRTRALRASRQSSRSAQLSISSMPTSPATEFTSDSADKITTSASSFPVFAGRLNTGASTGKGGPTSLANFIGGDTKIKGPVLNKVRPDQYAGAGLETDALDRPTATFLSRLNPGKDGPGHFGKNKVAMPGMVRTTSTPAAPTTNMEELNAAAIRREDTDDRKPKESASLPIPGAINHGEARPRSAQGLVHPTTQSEDGADVKPTASPILAPKAPFGASNASATLSNSTPGSALPTTKSSSSAYTPSASPRIGKISSPLLGRQEPQTSPSASEKMPTASLTRLQGSNLVKQRLAWGEEKSASSDVGVGSAKNSPVGSPIVGAGRFSPKIGTGSADAGSSAPSSPALGSSVANKAAKRGSVLDRWNIRQNTDEENDKNAASSYKAEYGIGTKPSVASSAAAQQARSPSAGAAPQAKVEPEDIARPDEPASATSVDYKSSYGVARSPALAASPQLPSSAQQSEPKTATTSSFSYKTDYGVKSPVETPASSWVKPSLDIDVKEESPAVPSTSNSTDYKAGYGVRSQSSNSSAYKAEYGVKSPVLASKVGEPELEIAPPAKQAESGADRNILTPITTAEPGRISPASKSPAPVSAGSAGGSSASFERPSKPPTFSSWPKPQSHSSNFARASPSASPKPTPSLPISVSPTPYSPSGKSPSATSPRTGTFQPSATSFPVSLGVAPTHSRPTSLAHFMGADRKVNGPVLNKVRQVDPASEGVDMGDSKGRVGTFLSGMNKDNLLAETARRKQGVPMPGMVPRSPGPISPKPIPAGTAALHAEQEGPTSVSGSETPAPRLPLPGMASPTLPLPGEDLGTKQAPQDDESQQSGSAIPSVLPEASSSFFPVHAATMTESTADPPSQTTTTTGEAIQTDDPSMSRLLRSGYSTQRSLETVQPSERMLATEKARPTAMEVSTEFVRQGHGALPAREPNPWADVPAGDKAEQGTVKSPILTDKAGWRATLKSLGKPARHAPRPPTTATSPAPATAKGTPPYIDISAFDAAILPVPHIRYVSVDILSIVGASTQAMPLPANGMHPVFYSSELLAIVLRRKEGGLMVTDLYIWQGRDSSIEAAEEGKITELEARYRTTAIDTRQGEEADELIKALGGGLVTRQGNRETFDVLNTTLYKVQMPTAALTFIDELDLQRSSLASCSSFVASIFQDIFVWHGRGSLDNERAAALAFAGSLASGDAEIGQRSIVELEEGHEDEFWIDVMGDEEYASANHWRFRRTHAASAKDHRPRIFKLQQDAAGRHELVLNKSLSIAPESSAVRIVETFFEIYIIVSESARMDKAAVAAAVHAAAMRAKQLDGHKHRPIRPFRLPISTLLLPSIIPLDLATLFRADIFACDQVPRAPDSIDLLDADETLSQLADLQCGKLLSMIGLDL